MKILFVCTGNTCRSPMAEGIFKQLTQNSNIKFSLQSAGLSTVQGLPAAENAVSACEEIGINIKSHKSTPITTVNINTIDLFVVMTLTHAQALIACGIPKSKIYVLDVPDPYGGDLQTYRQSLELIKNGLKILLTKIEDKEEHK